MKKTVLRQYARLIVRKGVSTKKGDSVLIVAELDQPEFVKMVVEECYKAGAAEVSVDWRYDPLGKIHVRNMSVKNLSHMENWQIEKWRWRAEKLPSMIYLESADPDGQKGVNQKKVSKAFSAKYKIIKPFRDQMESKYKWCIAAVPGVAWAKKVFPGLKKNEAVEKLWEAILFTSRVDDDPLAAWDAHNADLAARCEYLNSLGLASLEYKSANGTDFKVGLIDDGLFLGGGEYTLGKNEYFNPNIPSEEVFTSPKAGVAEGIVYASKPLSYHGELIENFSVRFEGGRAVEVHAEKGEELLKQMISMDEGAAMLGECALVPQKSPIAESNILFYNTLFDENAACHLALGHGFPNCLKDYDKYTLEECREKGINDSMNHVDFMIGTDDLEIVGVDKKGKRHPIFKDGNWAF
ncbi:MAG: aminopeptidase [Clostridia bacterium]|nr:aminopeptidase [Clostridia bacterium]